MDNPKEVKELIESELDMFKFDRLKVDDTILLHTPNRCATITILAITGSIFAVSKKDESKAFDRWVTKKELWDLLTILAEDLLTTADALFISLKDYY